MDALPRRSLSECQSNTDDPRHVSADDVAAKLDELAATLRTCKLLKRATIANYLKVLQYLQQVKVCGFEIRVILSHGAVAACDRGLAALDLRELRDVEAVERESKAYLCFIDPGIPKRVPWPWPVTSVADYDCGRYRLIELCVFVRWCMSRESRTDGRRWDNDSDVAELMTLEVDAERLAARLNECFGDNEMLFLYSLLERIGDCRQPEQPVEWDKLGGAGRLFRLLIELVCTEAAMRWIDARRPRLIEIAYVCEQIDTMLLFTQKPVRRRINFYTHVVSRTRPITYKRRLCDRHKQCKTLHVNACFTDGERPTVRAPASRRHAKQALEVKRR